MLLLIKRHTNTAFGAFLCLLLLHKSCLGASVFISMLIDLTVVECFVPHTFQRFGLNNRSDGVYINNRLSLPIPCRILFLRVPCQRYLVE